MEGRANKRKLWLFVPKQRKEYVAFFEKINTACDTIIETKKTTRKPQVPEQEVKKVSKVKDPTMTVN